jgi:hypothetical protein
LEGTVNGRWLRAAGAEEIVRPHHEGAFGQWTARVKHIV